MRFVLTGGASGGHTYPALALAREIEQTVEEAEIHLLIPERLFFPFAEEGGSSVNVHRLPGRGLNLSKPWTYPAVFLAWCRMFHETGARLDLIRPDVLVCFGSFLTVAATCWARNHGVPFILHEQNMRLGRAHRFSLTGASGLALGMQGAEQCIPEKWRAKARITGELVRQELMDRAARMRERRFHEKRHDQFKILVFGGSQGSRRLNQLIREAFSNVNTFFAESDSMTMERLKFLHIAGPEEAELMVDFYKSHKLDHAVFPYTEDMAALYEEADLLIGRAGAGTLTEAALYRLPLICIPHPTRHQCENARELAGRGALRNVEDGKDAAEVLAHNVAELIASAEAREALAESLHEMIPADGAERLLRWALELKGRYVYAH